MSRVAIYLENHLPGGLERHLGDLIRVLTAGGCAITVFHAGDPSRGERLARLATPASRLVPVSILSTKPWEDRLWARRPGKLAWQAMMMLFEGARWVFFLLNQRRLRRLFSTERFDLVIVVNGGYPAAMSAQSAILAAGRAGRAHVVLSLTGLPRRRRIPILERWVDRRVATALDRVWAVSNRGLDLLIERRGFPRAIGRIVHPGVDEPALAHHDRAALKRRYGLDSKTVVGGLSPMEPYKGQRFLIEALALLARDRPDLVLLLVGAGRERDTLEEMARRTGLAGRVVFTGFVAPDPLGCLSLMDVFVHPTLEDSFPHVVLEAMALGKAIVATDIGGIPEQIVDGESGIVVPAGDSRRLAAAIGHFLDHPELARAAGEAARRRYLERFTRRRLEETISAAIADIEKEASNHA